MLDLMTQGIIAGVWHYHDSFRVRGHAAFIINRFSKAEIKPKRQVQSFRRSRSFVLNFATQQATLRSSI